MASLKFGCVNANGLNAPWKQGLLLHDLRSLGIDVLAISETRLSDARRFCPIFGDYEIFASPSLPGMGGGVAVLFRKPLGLEVRPIFKYPESKLVVLDVNGSEGGAFRLAAVYAPT